MLNAIYKYFKPASPALLPSPGVTEDILASLNFFYHGSIKSYFDPSIDGNALEADEIKHAPAAMQTTPIQLPENYDDYRCPISLLIMFNPVSLNCGHIFEETEIKKWQAGAKQAKAVMQEYKLDDQHNPDTHQTCPMCKTFIVTLTPNTKRKEEIITFLKTIRSQWDPLMQTILKKQNEKLDWNQVVASIDLFLQEGNAEASLKESFKFAIRRFVIKPILEIPKATAAECQRTGNAMGFYC